MTLRRHKELLFPSDPARRYAYLVYSLPIAAAFLALLGKSSAPHLDGIPGVLVGASREFATGVSEALFVSFVVAKLVDPFIKARFAKELGADLFWALTSVEAPAEFRTAVQKLASLGHYYRSCDWDLAFEWVDETKQTLSVTISVRCNGVNLDRDGYRPPMRFWIMPSGPPFTSYHTSWSFEIPDLDVRQRLDKGHLEDLMADRRAWDEVISEELVVPFKVSYLSFKEGVVSPCGDMIPLISTYTSLKMRYCLHGPAARDLDFALKYTGDQPAETTTGEDHQSGAQTTVVNGTTFPGQVAVVSWSRKAPAVLDVTDRAAASEV